MKKFLPLLLIFVFWLMVFPGFAFAEAATLSLDPHSGTFNQGCTFSVNVNLDTGGADTDGTDAIIKYDSSRFLGQSITNGSLYPDFPGNNIDNANGKISILSLAAVDKPFNGKGVLATINFKVQSSAPAGSTQITFEFNPNDKSNTKDTNVIERGTIVDVLNSVTDGSYVIGTGSCSSQATPAPAPAATGTGTGTGVGTIPGSGSTRTPATGFQGGTFNSTPSGGVPIKTLPDGGTAELTAAMAIVGGVLTFLGILGLALL